MTPLYLDNAATTEMSKEVIDAMIESLCDYGNSQAKYYCFAENAKKRINEARNKVALSVGCQKDEVIFTSGATEANNLVIKGLADAHQERKKIIISSIEHSSIYETCNYLKTKGYEIVEIPVDKYGLIKLDYLDSQIDSNTLLVSIIWVNNEIGTIQNIKAIDDICMAHGVPFHSDSTQAIGKVDIDLSKYHALKYITFTAHKIYGPKGIGALIVKKENGCKSELVPIIHGGEQEYGYRAGTLSNELIVGFGKACEIITMNLEGNNLLMQKLENELIKRLKNRFDNKIIINNDFQNRVYGILNVQFIGLNNMIILKQVSTHIAASSGSACGVSKPSRVLKAIGLSDKEIDSSIRLSLSIHTRIEDIGVIDYL